VQSLARLLKNELHPDFKKKIIDILEEKLKILIKGYERREKWKDADKYKVMLESLVGRHLKE